jgi:uncharacterized protein (UPF0548 family)
LEEPKRDKNSFLNGNYLQQNILENVIFHKFQYQMKIHTLLQFPSYDWLQKQHALLREQNWSYAERGATRNQSPKGYQHDEADFCLGQGELLFEAAKSLLLKWKMFPAPWTRIYDPNPQFKTGMNVGVWFRFGGLWWGNAARIVYAIDEPTRFGFAYGTLRNHIERGEELFLLEMDQEGRVWYRIRAFSRPNRWYVYLAYPLVRQQQARFRRDSGRAMNQLLEREMLRSHAV